MNIARKQLFYRLAFLKAFGTIFALYVYSKFVGIVGDSHGYAQNIWAFTITDGVDGTVRNLLNRTEFTEFLFSNITFFTRSVFLTHLISSLFVGYCIYYIFKVLYPYINKYIFWLAISLPQFLIWTGVTTKELLSVALFSLFIKQVINIINEEKVAKLTLILAGTIGVFLRPHYGISYLYLLVSTIIIVNIIKGRTKVPSTSKRVVFSIFLSIFLIFLFLFVLAINYWDYAVEDLMYLSKTYFTGFSGSSTRYSLASNWNSAMDFITYIPTGFFVSLVGPTLNESIERPMFFVAFFEGVLYIAICIYLYFILLLKTLNFRSNLFITLVLYSFFPALILILFAHYPLGIWNPGTALRYRQNMVPLMIFFPLLLLGLQNKLTTQET